MLAAYTLIAEAEPNIGTEILIPVNNPLDTLEDSFKGHEVLDGNTRHNFFCKVNLVANEPDEAFRPD